MTDEGYRMEGYRMAGATYGVKKDVPTEVYDRADLDGQPVAELLARRVPSFEETSGRQWFQFAP